MLQYSEPIADNLLQGLNHDDYGTFAKDFNDAMKKAIPEQTFQTSLRAAVIDKIGDYLSREVSQVVQIGGMVTILYTAKFEKEDGVAIRLTLDVNPPHLVTGLYFNSPKLRGE